MRFAALLLFAFLTLAESGVADSYSIVTIAGSDWVGDNGPATSAILIQAQGIAVDLTGNIYVADAGDHRVRKISPAGVITTFAGTGMAGFSGDGGPAALAQLNSPYGLALDGMGNLYIADLGNARVRCVTTDGNIATVAGGGPLAPGGANEGSPAVAITLSAPRNVAWDGHGSLYISDFTGQRVFRLAENGSLTTVAGTGAAGASGDGGPAVNAQVNYPAGLAVDRSGALYIADSGNHAIRKVANNLITTFARASTPTGLAFDNYGTLYIADPGAGAIVLMPQNAPASTYALSAQDIACAFDSSLYAVSADVAWRISFSGPSSIVAGSGSFAHGDGGAATLARLNHPAGVAADAAGNLYIADRDNNRIRKVATNGVITTVAGAGPAGNSGDGGPAIAALLNAPESVSVDPSGNLYIADTGNARVRVVTTSGLILAVNAQGLIEPVYAVADGHGNVFIADAGAGSIVEYSQGGATMTLANGLDSPRGLALDANGNVYFTESSGAHVGRLAPDGTLALIGEGSWNIPRGVAVGASGDVFVADTGLQEILEVDASGNVLPVAGEGASGFSGDGGAATAAQLNFPWDVALDSSGNVYIADLENNRIRELTPAPSAPQLLPFTALNAASLEPGPVAPGMLVELAGVGSGSGAAISQVLFNQIGMPVLSISAASILVQAPAQLAGPSTEIQIISNGNVLAQSSIEIAEAAPALFASNGQALANNQDGSVNSTANPAARGSIVAFYGTGQGVANLPVTATVGGYSAAVLYAGPVVNYPGLFQINVQIPAGYISPGNLPVVICVGGAASQSGVFVAVD